MIQLSYSPGINKFLQTDQRLKIRYSPDKLEALSKNLFIKCQLFIGSTLTVEDVKELAKILSGALNTGPGVFIGVLQYFRVYPLTEGGLLFLCRQMVAKKSSLVNAKIIDVFRGSLTYGWFPFQIESVSPGEGFKYYLHCRFIEGFPVGLKFQLLTDNKSSYRFFVEGGLGKRALKEVKLSSLELTGFKYYALIKPEAFTPLNTSGEVNLFPYESIGSIRATGTQSHHNRKVFTSRSNPCPVNLSLPCNLCFVGLDNCFRACRITTNWAINKTPPQEIHVVPQNK